MISFLIGLVVGAALGYAFRGKIHAEVVKVGDEIKNKTE